MSERAKLGAPDIILMYSFILVICALSCCAGIFFERGNSRVSGMTYLCVSVDGTTSMLGVAPRGEAKLSTNLSGPHEVVIKFCSPEQRENFDRRRNSHQRPAP